MAAEEKRVYMLTQKGHAELTGAKSTLGTAELKLLVMVDGAATVERIAQRVDGAPDVAAVGKVLHELARAGYVADPDGSAAIDVKEFFKQIDSTVASLQANGYFVRIARRAPPPAPKGKVTVLVVEDDEHLAKLLRMYLQMEDFAVRVAATREQIIAAVREQPKPDIVLLDVVLPDSDGFAVLEKMCAHDYMKAVPVIMATAKASREAVLTGLRCGADGYITKPYDVPVLVTAIKSVLGLK